MKEKSIWYQGGKAALVLLFAALMAVLFFSCSAEQKEWVIRTNTQIKFMHIVWIVVAVAFLAGLLYILYKEILYTEEYKRIYGELETTIYYAKNCSKARKHMKIVSDKIIYYRSLDMMSDKEFSDKVLELSNIYLIRFVKD